MFYNIQNWFMLVKKKTWKISDLDKKWMKEGQFAMKHIHNKFITNIPLTDDIFKAASH